MCNMFASGVTWADAHPKKVDNDCKFCKQEEIVNHKSDECDLSYDGETLCVDVDIPLTWCSATGYYSFSINYCPMYGRKLKKVIMKQERILSFGKYKGQEVKYIILTHIGYIMWCFENINRFKLTDEEQALYDAVAIMIKKYDTQMTFPVELMYKYVSDKEALEKLDTPFVEYCGYTCIKKEYAGTEIYKSVEKYKSVDPDILERSLIGSISLDGLRHLSHSMSKEIERAYSNGESVDDIFGGWGSMNDYKN